MPVKQKTYSLLRTASFIGIILLLILQLIWLYNTSKIAQENFIQQAQACIKKAIDEELDVRFESIKCKRVYDFSENPLGIKKEIVKGDISNFSEGNYVSDEFLNLSNIPFNIQVFDSLLNKEFKSNLVFVPKYKIRIKSCPEYRFRKDVYKPYEHIVKNNVIYIESRFGLKRAVEISFKSSFLIIYKLNASILIISFVLILLISIVLILQYKNFKREKKFSQFIIDYTRMIAHDLQSPVSSFRMMLQHFKANPKMETKKMDEFCTMGMDHSDRILFSLSNLLFLASSEQNDFKINKSPAEISLVLEPLSQRIQRMDSKDKRISINIHYKPDRIFIPMDKNLMENVFFNLMENAVKFSEEIVTITVVVIENKQDYQITFQDNGIGMPEEVQERIFDLYDRGNKQSGTLFSGYGIGLSFAQKVVKAHGGTISVNSKPDWGSIFTITLPKHY